MIGDPEDVKIPARPDADNSDSAGDDTLQTHNMEGDKTAGNDAHRVQPKAGSGLGGSSTSSEARSARYAASRGRRIETNNQKTLASWGTHQSRVSSL